MFYLFTSNNLEKLRMNPFKGLIEEELERFEKRLDEVLVADVDLAHDIARYMSTLKGKRFAACSGPAQWTGGGAAGERTGHRSRRGGRDDPTATMAHDDVVDSATMRRGRDSVNEVWTGQIAVLMGDFLLARALPYAR